MRLETLTTELGDLWLVSRILMRREAISSSAIEGTNSTLDELLAAEETGDTRGQPAAIQVKDYALCLDGVVPKAIALGPVVFTDALVRDLHRATMRNDPDYADVPGELRTKIIWIGGRGNCFGGRIAGDPAGAARAADDVALAPAVSGRVGGVTRTGRAAALSGENDRAAGLGAGRQPGAGHAGAAATDGGGYPDRAYWLSAESVVRGDRGSLHHQPSVRRGTGFAPGAREKSPGVTWFTANPWPGL